MTSLASVQIMTRHATLHAQSHAVVRAIPALESRATLHHASPHATRAKAPHVSIPAQVVSGRAYSVHVKVHVNAGLHSPLYRFFGFFFFFTFFNSIRSANLSYRDS